MIFFFLIALSNLIAEVWFKTKCNDVPSPHPTGKHNLDLGCGTGNLSSVIAEKIGANGRLVGVDPDGARIALARKTFGHLENLNLVEGSSDALVNDFGKASFDAVFSNYVLHWVKDKRRAFKNIYEILKPGGQVVMLYETEIIPLLDKAVKVLNPEENYRKMKEMFFCVSKENIESYCRDAGLVISESIEINQRAVHKNLSDFLVVVSSSTHGNFDLDLIEEKDLKEFDQWIDKKGSFIHDFPLGIVPARKAIPLQ